MINMEMVKTVSEEAYQFFCHIKKYVPEDGHYTLNNGVYVNVETYKTQRRKERRFETHKQYIDIQYLIHGKEIIIVQDIAALSRNFISEKYDMARDIEFYADNDMGKQHVLKTGEFLILYPSDAHMPCISIGRGETVRKAVAKIPVKNI